MGTDADPYMSGGGLYPRRRLNLLIYLNEGWNEENGGWLELWDREMKSCAKRVLHEFNQKLWRKSIALYYFSNGRER